MTKTNDLHEYTVTTLAPESEPLHQTLYSTSRTDAIFTALELSPPGSSLIRCTKQSDW